MKRRYLALGGLTSVLVFVCTAYPNAAAAQALGPDLAGLYLCLYGHCEARGAYAADPYTGVNPASLAVGSFTYVRRGAFPTGVYYRLNAGRFGADFEGGQLTLASAPYAFQVSTVYAEGSGLLPGVPPFDVHLRTRAVWLAGAIDLGQTSLELRGLSLGVRGALPVTDTDLRVSFGGFNIVTAADHREIDATLGVNWRTGLHDWFMVGAFVNPQRSHAFTAGTNALTMQPFRQSGTTNLWFTRAGIRVAPFVPLGVSADHPPGELLLGIRFFADAEHRNIAVHDSPSRREQTGYFGADARLLPDAWNPLADYLRVDVISGIDTDTGWGLGLGLYGNGPLGFLGCNPGYSSRPRLESLGDRMDIWAISCGMGVPL